MFFDNRVRLYVGC